MLSTAIVTIKLKKQETATTVKQSFSRLPKQLGS